MEFIEAPAFTKHVGGYLDDDEYRQLQDWLASDPTLGDVIEGAGGFRKVRWRDPRRGKGRRGGLRIIYFYFEREQQVWLITLFDKSEAADLTPAQKRGLKAAIEQETRSRARRRGR